ncbi:bifunctional 5,10-methylenetetrahydrofolate dehydrogenase/5,10-methenyltetrahydrofolate cyclohydrolase [Halobacteriovorax sp. XZX-3]|uniref:bifunctional 5,10-methylenetetrahydrofolate dehydrogenase/5,10-methenyltetrahydrofolate cyclohydrolase n=1 Tax=unclassified Halobacteriovorax TaxID=2639665 RepID=UPI0037220EE2
MQNETKLLYAQPVIERQVELLKEECGSLKSMGTTPCLKVILVGNNPASVIYTNSKKKFAEKIGASCEIVNLEDSISEEEFLKIVNQFNKDPSVHGILIQLPLPKSLSQVDTTDLVVPHKDVDGFHYENVAKLYRGQLGETSMIPCTPKGIVTMAKYYGIDFTGKNVVIVGRSLIVGKPLSLLLTNLNATVTLAHSKTQNLKELTQSADIIVTAIGSPKLFTKEYFRNDQTQVVFDVGINRSIDGKLCGDCDFDNIKDQLAAITPVPKGIGPMTIFSVSQNLISAAKK